MKSTQIGFKPTKTFIAVSLATSAIFANNAFARAVTVSIPIQISRN